MTNREQTFKMLEGRIDTMQQLALESIDLIYNGGYNEAIEAAAIEIGKKMEYPTLACAIIRGLKK